MIIAVALGFSFILGIQVLARQGKLSFRYAIGWSLLGILSVVSGALIPAAGSLARIVPVTPSAFFAICAAFLLTSISVQLSISISGMQEQIRSLAEEVALLRHELDRINNNE